MILARRDYGEADRIIILLAPEGRFDLLAKGIRKPRSRKSGHLELFTRAKVLVSRVKGSWDILSQAEMQGARRHVQEDFDLGTRARYIAELAIRFFEEDTGGALFSLVDETLARLDACAEPDLLVRWYEQQILILAGFRPEWHLCVGEREHKQCHRPLTPQPHDKRPYGIDLEHGGALCPECWVAVQEGRMPGHSARPLSPSALSWLQALQRRDYEDVVQYPFSERTAKELFRTMEQYISYHLERRPAALKLMR